MVIHDPAAEAPRLRIQEYVLGLLSEQEARVVEQHVRNEDCVACRDELRLARELHGKLAFAAKPVEPPEALRGRLFSALRTPPPEAEDASPPRP